MRKSPANLEYIILRNIMRMVSFLPQAHKMFSKYNILLKQICVYIYITYIYITYIYIDTYI